MTRLREKPILKSKGEIEAFKAAGALSAKVLRLAGEIIRPGISTWEIDEYIETMIRLEGGTPSFKGLYGFPGSACISINDMVVHGIPSKKVILKSGDIVSIDTGATVDGWVGDNAYTYAVGTIDDGSRELLEVTEQCMWAGIEAAQPGNTLGDIGHAIQSLAESHGFGVLREYVGHGVGRAMHEPPNVPNYGRPGKGMKLEPGLVIAIEPMITFGDYRVHTIADGWGVVTNDGSNAAHFEKTIAVTEDGPVVITNE